MNTKATLAPNKRGLWQYRLWHRLHGHVVMQVFTGHADIKRHRCADCGTIWQAHR